MTIDLTFYFGLFCLGAFAPLAVALTVNLDLAALKTRAPIIGLALVIALTSLVIKLSFFGDALDHPILLILALIDTPSLILLWLLIRVIVEDGEGFGRLEWGMGILYVCVLAWERIAMNGSMLLPEAVLVVAALISAVLLVYMIILLLKGRTNDLVASRQSKRRWLATVLALAILASVRTSFGGFSMATAPWAFSLSLAPLLAGIVFATVYLMNLNREGRAVAKAESDRSGPELNARKMQQYEKLLRHMEDDKAFLDPGLSIGRLAKAIGLGEHTLRSLINQCLGYRNYSHFVNGYRVAHAKALLADAARTDLPIITIALDSGFRTLSAFNRAFKAEEGVPPSAYRKQKLTT